MDQNIIVQEVATAGEPGKRAWGVALSRDERTLFVANGLMM
jgi:hypothetical protein